MKKYAILILLLSVCSLSAKKSPENFEFGLGPNISLKTSVSYIETPSGRKNGVGISEMPGFGLTAYIPFNDHTRIGGIIDLNYETYNYIIEDYETAHRYSNSHSYFNIAPQFYFANFLIGFNVGIPMGINIEDNNNADSDIMNTSFELVFGGLFNMYNDKTGRIDFFIKGQFMLTGIYDDFVKNDPMKYSCPVCPRVINDSHNPKTGSIMFGFTYMFNLTQNNSY